MDRRTQVIAAAAMVAVAALIGAYMAFRGVPDAGPAGGRNLPAPAQAIQSILELRSHNSSDTTGYARYVESTEVAQALAQDAAIAQGTSPIPEWLPPKVVRSSETTADVLVRWKPSTVFKGWPKSTTFTLRRVSGRWKIVDAVATGVAESTGSTGSGSP